MHYWNLRAWNYVNKVQNFSFFFAGRFSQKILASCLLSLTLQWNSSGHQKQQVKPHFPFYYSFLSTLYLFLQKVFFLSIPLWPAPYLLMRWRNSIRISILLTSLGFQSVTLKMVLNFTGMNTTLVVGFPL